MIRLSWVPFLLMERRTGELPSHPTMRRRGFKDKTLSHTHPPCVSASAPGNVTVAAAGIGGYNDVQSSPDQSWGRHHERSCIVFAGNPGLGESAGTGAGSRSPGHAVAQVDLAQPYPHAERR